MFSKLHYSKCVCASVLERKNLIASPFTSPEDTPGVGRGKVQVLKVLVLLKCVLISRWFVV